jgi:hypothetical protein
MSARALNARTAHPSASTADASREVGSAARGEALATSVWVVYACLASVVALRGGGLAGVEYGTKRMRNCNDSRERR